MTSNACWRGHMRSWVTVLRAPSSTQLVDSGAELGPAMSSLAVTIRDAQRVSATRARPATGAVSHCWLSNADELLHELSARFRATHVMSPHHRLGLAKPKQQTTHLRHTRHIWTPSIFLSIKGLSCRSRMTFSSVTLIEGARTDPATAISICGVSQVRQ